VAGESKRTTDRDEIRRWAEARGGRPARVQDTGSAGDAGILRIDFPGRGDGDRLEELSWDEWFEAFDESGLAFVYQEESSEGGESRVSKLVTR
jgi:hypothetical protein